MTIRFDFLPTLKGSLVLLKPLSQADYDGLQDVASSLDTWASYPNLKVQQTGSLSAWFTMGIEASKALKIIDLETSRLIGTTRYYALPSEDDGIGIGYTFIDASHRRAGKTNADLKRLMFAHAFRQVGTIWFHVLPDNLRSQAAVRKLGVEEHGIQRLQLTDQPLAYATFSVRKPPKKT